MGSDERSRLPGGLTQAYVMANECHYPVYKQEGEA
jgi:hypothetical protein